MHMGFEQWNIEDDSQRFFDSNYMMANYDYVKEFCDQNGNLNYVVQIFDNNFLMKIFELGIS